jgi:hypothetical protein
MTKLLQRFQLTPEVRCDVIRHQDERVLAHLYPVCGDIYWKTHTTLDLTQRELREILEVVQKGQERK